MNYTPLVGRALINTNIKVIYGAVGSVVACCGERIGKLRRGLWYAVRRALLDNGWPWRCGVRGGRLQGGLCGAGRPMLVREANTYKKNFAPDIC